MKKLLLIDGMAAVYRGYYAMSASPRINSKGMNTSAALGFATTLYDLLRKQKPTHIGVAFDLPAPTFRHQMFPDYKANRDPMPEEIQTNLPWIHRIIDAFRIPQLTCEGFEADDVIGTLSVAAQQAGFDQIVMVTPDKDFAQLVSPCIKLYRFGRGKTPDRILGVAEVCEKFGVASPEQVIDLLGLWGDTVDNIPGIRGVGEKTAQKLIAQFGSIEEMVAHVDDILNDRLRENVRQHAADALFSKQLATIRIDAPIAFDEEALSIAPPDYDLLRDICDQLEFRQFARRVFSDCTPTLSSAPTHPSAPSLFSPQAPAPDVSAPSLFDSAISPVHDKVSLALEPLTSDVLQRIAGQAISLAFKGPEIALATDADHVWTTRLSDLDLPLFRSLWAPSSLTLCADLKSLKYFLAELDVPFQGEAFDIAIAHYLIDPELRHTIGYIASGLLGFTPSSLAEEAAAMWQLYPLLTSRLREAGLEKLYSEVELPLVDVLIAMEQAGVRINTDALAQYSADLAKERDAVEQQIFALAGHSFNISSTRQLGEVLYDELKVTDKPPRTSTHQYSTAEEALSSLASAHPIIPLILDYRSLSKLIGTYLDNFPSLISPIDHRLHTVYNQTVTATGRLSSSNPNLQNIPIRTERGREIRRAFVPADADHLILAADYSQVELRIIASLSRDRNLLDAFNAGLDIHAATAAKIYHLPISEVTPDQRRNAKSVNFGIVYGISPFGLAQQLGIPRKEAAALIDEYFVQYPEVQRFIEHCKDEARQKGYAQTLLGRRRYLPDIASRNAAARSFAERNAVNMPIQGTSADMIKLAMNAIHSQLTLRHLRTKLILQIHDELVFDLYRPEESEVRALVVSQMQSALPLEGLTLEVGIGVGNNWLEAH
ncbi:MAG: DNA polymerase I [Bacteroidales bacterium]|nr:DNA polymerase I [Bacteroidales bacterium]